MVGQFVLSASNVPLAWWAVSPVSLYTSALGDNKCCRAHVNMRHWFRCFHVSSVLRQFTNILLRDLVLFVTVHGCAFSNARLFYFL